MKKLVIGGLIVALGGALGVGIYSYTPGDNSLRAGQAVAQGPNGDQGYRGDRGDDFFAPSYGNDGGHGNAIARTDPGNGRGAGNRGYKSERAGKVERSASGDGTDVPDPNANVGGGNTTIDSVALNDSLNQVPSGTLSDAEVEGLLYMREEEKLARDVYLTLYEKWEMPIFQNIGSSEQTHMDAVKTLLDRYGLEDPAASRDVGIFVNPTLQGLYDRLIEEGDQSLAEALRVGAAIEEIDILDLEESIAETDKADVRLVYENLMKGSRNHLRSFVSTLERRTDETYRPQYLGQPTYDAIVNAPIERGRGRRS
jgi:hypothetical protein